MNNDFNEKDNLNDKKEKSLLRDMAKKGISKKIKAMPLKTKLIIGGIILGVVLFILFFAFTHPGGLLFESDYTSAFMCHG